MNTKYIYMPVIVLSFIANFASAVPIGSSGQDRDYLISEQPLQQWSLGVFAESRTRDVKLNNNGYPVEMETTKTMGYVGYDAISWINTYVTYGLQKDSVYGDGSSEAAYGFGATFNLLDHEMMDPSLMEDRIRLSATIQYTFGTFDNGFGDSEAMDELYGSFIMSIVNDIEGNKQYWPNAISIFAGPIFSQIISDSIQEDSIVGLTVGVEVFLSDYVTLGIGLEQFEDNGSWMALSIKF